MEPGTRENPEGASVHLAQRMVRADRGFAEMQCADDQGSLYCANADAAPAEGLFAIVRKGQLLVNRLAPSWVEAAVSAAGVPQPPECGLGASGGLHERPLCALAAFRDGATRQGKARDVAGFDRVLQA